MHNMIIHSVYRLDKIYRYFAVNLTSTRDMWYMYNAYLAHLLDKTA